MLPKCSNTRVKTILPKFEPSNQVDPILECPIKTKQKRRNNFLSFLLWLNSPSQDPFDLTTWARVFMRRHFKGSIPRISILLGENNVSNYITWKKVNIIIRANQLIYWITGNVNLLINVKVLGRTPWIGL